MSSDSRNRLREVVVLFLRLGITSFGGPAAHIAIMHDEVVKRRRWVSEAEFLDLLGAANLIPGPTSTELAIYLGYRRVGWIGLVLAGVCFILPAMLIVTALAWAYVRYGSTPIASGVLYGVLPVVIAIVASALWGLGRKAVKNILTAVLGVLVVIFYYLGVNVLILLLGAGIAALVVQNRAQIRWANRKGMIIPLAGAGLPTAAVASLPAAAAMTFSLPVLFLTFLKIGAVLYGSGYVLLAFIRNDFVLRLGWLTDQQLVDAIAIGQVTPGPLFTAATFIGYILGGTSGALLATLGIFLPSFILVAISNPFIPRIRNSTWMPTPPTS
jgi:chromate transporter